MKPCYLAIDIGASSGRAIAGEVDASGKITLTEVYRFPNGMQKKQGHLVWDLDGLFEEVLSGMAEARKQGFAPVSVGIDTWAVDYVLLDENDRRIGLPYAYRDSRADGIRDELEKSHVLSFSEHYERCGIQYQPFNTCYQLLAQKKEHPEDIERARTFLMVPDYLNFRLCGVKANEYTNASTTALVDAETKMWDSELIERLGLPRDIFSGPTMPGCVLGELLPEIAERVGYQTKVVLPATHDTGSAWLAVPAKDEQTAYLSSGTWSLLGCELTEPITTDASRKANFTNEGGFEGRFRYLKNIMGLWMIQNVRRECPHEDGSLPGWGELVAGARAAAAEGFASSVNADAERFLAPESMVEELRSACRESGQKAPETPGELAYTVYRSLAEDYAKTVKELSELTGIDSANQYLNELCADAAGLAVTAGPMEGTALGNLMVQAMTEGTFGTLEEARAAIRKSFDIKEVQAR
jgi:rhamnulokinase